jgi:hypothetical protein
VYPKPGKVTKGKDAALQQAAARLRAGTTRVVLALDIDQGASEELVKHVVARLRKELGAEGNKLHASPGGSRLLEFGAARLAIWPMPLAPDPLLADSFGIRSHSIEDLLIKALQDRECREKLIQSEDKVRVPEEVDPWGTTRALLAAARKDGFELSSSKQVLKIFQALMGFGGSPATFAEVVIKHAAGTGGDSAFELPPDFVLP